MTVDDGAPLSRDFEVRINPNLEGVTEADLRERFALAIRIRDRVTEANEAVIRVRNVKGQVDDRLEETDNDEIEAQAVVVKDNLGAVEGGDLPGEEPEQPGPAQLSHQDQQQAGRAVGAGGGSESRPTDQSYMVFRRLADLLDQQMKQMGIVILRDVGRLDELLVREGLEPIQEGRLVS